MLFRIPEQTFRKRSVKSVKSVNGSDAVSCGGRGKDSPERVGEVGEVGERVQWGQLRRAGKRLSGKGR
eukprot:13883972-Alexandrium_andersonii.AAC.1